MAHTLAAGFDLGGGRVAHAQEDPCSQNRAWGTLKTYSGVKCADDIMRPVSGGERVSNEARGTRPDKWTGKGSPPSGSWDEGDKSTRPHWDIDNGKGRRNGGRQRYDEYGTPLTPGQVHNPIPLSTVGKVGFWTTVGAVAVRAGIALGRAAAACVESGLCEAY